MYLVIDLEQYDGVRVQSFAPQVDLTNDALPANEFVVDIITDDEIPAGQYAELRDDMDGLWAKYWIISAERQSADCVRVTARADIWLLDGVTLPAVMYSAVDVEDVLPAVMVRRAGAGLVTPIDYSLAASLEGTKITGYCPQQSARERLQWLCTVVGAYVKTAFNTEIEILPIDTGAALIPVERTFMEPAPTVTMDALVTEIRVTAFTFTEGTPGATDEYIEVGGTYYIVGRQVISLENNEATSMDPDNPVVIDGLYLINSANASAILSWLAARYFVRAVVDADIIDNAEHVPGDLVTIHTDAQTMYGGHIEAATFAFGVQARASLHVVGATNIPGAALTITYRWDGNDLDVEDYFLPVGYAYSVQTRYIDATINGHRYIFRPTVTEVTGTMTSGGRAVTVTCVVALDLYNGTLHVVNVDGITTQTVGSDVVGVIA